MTDKKQSAVARRLSQKLSTLSTETSIIGDQNLSNAISNLETQSNYLTSELPTIKDNASYAQANVSFHSDPTNLGGWEARIVDLENNPSGGGGIDPTDPTQPILIWDNFIQQSNGDESGTVLPYSFAGPPRPTSSKTLTPTGLVIYEANSETDHIGIVQVTLEQLVGSGYLNLVNAPTLDSFVFDDLNTIYFIIKTENPTDSYKIKLGLFADIANPTQGIYFEGTSGANWVPTTDNGTASTGTTTALASSTWYTLKIQKKSATSVGFTVNTGTEVVLSTNIPTSFLTCGVYFENTTGSPSEDISFKLDFFSLKLGDVTPVLPTGTTVEGTPNEVEVTTVGSVVTVGLPNSIIVPTINTSQLNFNITPLSPTNTIGGQYWDTTYNTLSLGLTTNTNLKIGQGLYKYVRNKTGFLIPKGKVVYVNGHHASTQLTIGLANATTEATSADVIGVTAEDIADNTSGFVQTFGYLTGFATNTAEIPVGQEGKALYLSATTSGDMRIGLPIQPLHGVRVGFLVQRSGTGAMFINVQNYQELKELSDVGITSIANNDVLQWDNTDLRWENRSLATAGIAAASHTHPLSDLTQSSATPNQVPQWNGTNWVPVTLSTGGSPGGSTGQVQYNNASAFAGATNVKINSNNLELVKPASEPTTAPADSVVMYTKSIGQRDLPAFVDSSGWSTNLQTCIARNKFSMMNFNAGTTTVPTSTGFIYTATSVGTGNTTNGTVTIGTTSLLAGSRRNSFLTANTDGNAAGWRTSVPQCWRGNETGRGGFFCVWKFGIGDTTLQSGGTLFVGLNDSTLVPDSTAIQNPVTTVNASMRNTVGLVLYNNSTTYTIVHRNGVAAATTIPLTGFTANLTDIVEFCLYAAPNDTTIHYYVKIYADNGSNQETQGNIGTSNIPSNTTLFVPHCWRGRAILASTTVAVHCHTFSVEQPH